MTDFFTKLAHEFKLPLDNPVLVFSLILFIILLAPILLKKLNIPGIIGLIISGVLIGPYGFNLLAKNSAVDLFSTIGLLYIMFIAGLELDLNEFKAHKNKSLIFGLLTFIIPLSIGFPVCYYLLDYDFDASFLTASMFATHTLVAYPIVSKYGISKNQAVAITIGGTILTDTAVLIILAIVMGKSQGTLDTSFWIRMGISLAIFTGIMFIIVPRIAKWFFRKLEGEKYAHYIFVLSVVFFSAFLAEVAGVEPIIGAFVSGLALNPLIPHSSALMNRIEFIGNSLFIPFFLISVGMLVDVSVILSGPMAIVIALTLSAVALSSKWIAAFFTQISFKYSVAQRQLIFGLSGAHAAATIAVILVGYQAHILDENILNGTIILILITCVVASFATEQASKKIVLTEEPTNLSELQKDIDHQESILIPVENFSKGEILLDFALMIRDKNSQKPITILTVIPDDDQAELNIVKQKKEFEKFVSQGSAAESKINTIATIDNQIPNGIQRISKEIMADFVLLDWPTKKGFIDKFWAEKGDSMINKIDRNLFVCRITKPLIETQRVVFICPPLSVKELGFSSILQKVCRISQEFSATIVMFGEKSTYDAILQILSNLKLNPKIVFKEFKYWEDFLVITKEINPNDLVIFNSSKKSQLSYESFVDKVPSKFERYLSENNLIIVYSQEQSLSSSINDYENFSPQPLSKGIETIEQIGKGIGNIFKKKE